MMIPTCKSSPDHQNFIDWMKAVGMFFIVVGHVVGNPFNQFTQPIYPKQLGVAFFVFITAWSLANEKRPRLRVVFNRLFPVYLFGLGCAFFLSFLFFFLKNDINPSNYLPFFGGVNVLFNYFPANPTTWYIGTYLHLVLCWAFFFPGRVIKKWHICLSLIVEIVIRALIMTNGKPFIAYMLLPNWFTIFLLGMFFANKQDTKDSRQFIILLLLWAGVFAVWALIGNAVGFDTAFPFRNVNEAFPLAVLFRSALISLIYFVHTALFFAIARRLPSLRMISFFARNTLIIFIVHMPVIYECSSYIYSYFESTFLKKLTLILILYVGLAFFSEFIHRLINVKALREKVWNMLSAKLKAGG